MKKHVVFFGDSLTVGEGNNNISFADYFSNNNQDFICNICGVSGACFGNYSIYPVDKYLLQMILDHIDLVKNADLIVIEFGLNDTAAVATGYATFNQVCVSIARALDCIFQLNHEVKIIFIDPSNQTDINFMSHMFNYIKYMNHDYFLNYPSLTCSVDRFRDAYLKIVDFISKIKYNNVELISVSKLCLAEDGIHFNECGYRSLAEKLRLFIRENNFIN